MNQFKILYGDVLYLLFSATVKKSSDLKEKPQKSLTNANLKATP